MKLVLSLISKQPKKFILRHYSISSEFGSKHSFLLLGGFLLYSPLLDTLTPNNVQISMRKLKCPLFIAIYFKNKTTQKHLIFFYRL